MEQTTVQPEPTLATPALAEVASFEPAVEQPLQLKTRDLPVRKVQKILIDPNMIKLGTAFGFSILANCFLTLGFLWLIPQQHKEHLYQTYEMGYAMGVNCGTDPAKCSRACFELLKDETSGASCAKGVNNGYTNKDEFESGGGSP